MVYLHHCKSLLSEHAECWLAECCFLDGFAQASHVAWMSFKSAPAEFWWLHSHSYHAQCYGHHVAMQLTYIDLEQNQLTGTLPESWSNLAQVSHWHHRLHVLHLCCRRTVLQGLSQNRSCKGTYQTILVMLLPFVARVWVPWSQNCTCLLWWIATKLLHAK